MLHAYLIYIAYTFFRLLFLSWLLIVDSGCIDCLTKSQSTYALLISQACLLWSTGHFTLQTFYLSILNKLGICPIRKPKSAWAMLPQFLQNPLGIFNNLLSQIITKSCTNITVFSCLIAFLLMVYNTENYCYPTWKLRKRKLDFSFLAFLIILLVSDTLAVVEYMYIIKQSFHSISLYKNSKPTWVHIQNW